MTKKDFREIKAMEHRMHTEAKRQGGCLARRVGMAFQHKWVVGLTEKIMVPRGRGGDERLVTQFLTVELVCAECGKRKRI